MGAHTCWHCLYGHLFPGAFIAWLGVLAFGSALTAAPPTPPLVLLPSTIDRARLILDLVVGPALVVGELLTHNSWSFHSLQHLSMYFIVCLDGCMTYLTKIARPPLVPKAFLGFFEFSVLTIIGFEMAHHTQGNPLFTGMHHIMMYLLSLAGALLLVARFMCWALPPPIQQAIYLSISVVLFGTGIWFAMIGVGFFLYGDHGVLGHEKDTTSHKGHGALSLLLAVDFIFTLALLIGVWTIIERGLQGKRGDNTKSYEMLVNTADSVLVEEGGGEGEELVDTKEGSV